MSFEDVEYAEVVKEIVFLCGRIEGFDDFNAPLFQIIAEWLEQKGYEVLNPHTIDHVSDVMTNHRIDTGEMLDCDIVAAINCQPISYKNKDEAGWSTSYSATSKLVIAQQLGMKIITIEGDEKEGFVIKDFDYTFEFFARNNKRNSLLQNVTI